MEKFSGIEIGWRKNDFLSANLFENEVGLKFICKALSTDK
jgi:hypothetical protein